MWDIREGMVGTVIFKPKHAIIVTWKNVTFAGGSVNTDAKHVVSGGTRRWSGGTVIMIRRKKRSRRSVGECGKDGRSTMRKGMTCVLRGEERRTRRFNYVGVGLRERAEGEVFKGETWKL